MNAGVDSTVSLSGYRLIQRLYCSSQTQVYRAIRDSDHYPVVIKLLKQDCPSLSQLLQFCNQYTITKNLPLPGVVEPYSLEPYGKSYALVMEDFGGISLQEYTTTYAIELDEILEIAIQLAEILNGLYQNRVVHKDLTPFNILINPETKQVKLTDFSIACLLPCETPSFANSQRREGTLAYLSPEQTGRMNRGIDHRSDFYSLGVTLFELLTGQLPFPSQDRIEVVHCHIAKQPPQVDHLNQQIPLVVSNIVSKLMAKNAEERYQSAFGLKHDLKLCRQRLEDGQIESFNLGKYDVCDRFLIPNILYGRESEVAALLAAFVRIASPRKKRATTEDRQKLLCSPCSELCLISGASGIGKTALVNQVQKLMVQQRGYFIEGKFDQLNHNIPLSAFVQAFRDLMGQLLSESDIQLQAWQSAILKAVGENGQVLIEVIPELEQIIGKQNPVPELSGSAAQNRFNLVFQKFIQVFTTPDHPLVLFLDDLQWTDSASLQLMQLLLISEQINNHLLLIGAYRGEEVGAAHPLQLTLEEISQTNAAIQVITLAPLTQAKINHLVADTLNCSLELAQPLAELVYCKAQGNPFFTVEFLKTLYEDGYLTFNREEHSWQCDIAQVNRLSLTADVVEFMALQLKKLPEKTRTLLQLSACIGNQFDLTTLAIVYEKSPVETATDLWQALREGLILLNREVYKFRQSESGKETNSESLVGLSYRFLHDRIQQAAYSLIADDQKLSVHRRMGQLLLHNIPPAAREERIFEFIHHLNLSAALITQQAERDALAHLNLTAARKARTATAYRVAIDYLRTGLNLLSDNSWHDQYELTLTLHESLAEAAFLSGEFGQMQQWIEVIEKQARSLLDKINAYEIKIYAHSAQKNLRGAVKTGLQILEQLGFALPNSPTDADIQEAIAHTKALLPTAGIEHLINLPEMTQPQALAAMRMSYAYAAAAYMSSPPLFLLSSLAEIRTSIEHGNAPMSAAAYAHHGLILCGVLNDIDQGYEFGKLALRLAERYNNKALNSKVYFLAATMILPWQDAIKDSLPLLQAAYQDGIESGHLEVASVCCYHMALCSYVMGQELTSLEAKVASLSQQVRQIHQDLIVKMCENTRQAILNLQGRASNPCQLMGEAVDEEELIIQYQSVNHLLALYSLHWHKLILCYLFGEYDAALEQAELAFSYLEGATAQIVVPLLYFYDSLTRLAIADAQSQPVATELLAAVTANQEKLKHWAKHAPQNYQHKYDLVAGNYYWLKGRFIEAIEYFERAIAGAKNNGYIQEEALANELTAKFYLYWGKEKVAQVYMQEAYQGYDSWGATAKTDDLQQHYPHLLQTILQPQKLGFDPLEALAMFPQDVIENPTPVVSTGNSSIVYGFDFASLLKTAQALSSTIELDELIATLTQIILKNAGAETCVLMLPGQEQWQIRAITQINSDEQPLLQPQSLDSSQAVPLRLIQYVRRTLKSVVIEEGKTDIPGIIDHYLLQHQPQSVLCTPILNQGHLVAILYLENRSTKGVFTRDCLLVVNFLCTQAAISLENARLYQQAQQALSNLQSAQLQLVQSEKMSVLGNLVAGVAHEINNPIGFISGNLNAAKRGVHELTEHLNLYREQASTTNIIHHAQEIDLEYLLKDLPKMIDSMQVGCDRIISISDSLRTFSRADQDYKVPFNLHEGIDSTLIILKHCLKANETRPKIKVSKDYADLPPINCFPGQLNQVFMNILSNAINAIDESNQRKHYQAIEKNLNQITIRTSILDEKHVSIQIHDNGIGIPEEIKPRIFDHLFTTKSVGKGTGLGLAITRQIVVEKHGGVIEVNSVLGQGTEFEIRLPVHG
ncbi:AAA family ATPase [Lyngbya aestuarii]|uniref:AAA family ATPase n=1 Tax=Lyngbya aestuarii TaxID=118322 RepID=UPI00403D617A